MLVQPVASRPRQAVWGLGFRPFFLGGSLFALLALLLWAGVLAGALARTPAGGMLAWHRHEMLFGFAAAIIAGFLLTAVQNWSGIPGLLDRACLLLSVAVPLAFAKGLGDSPHTSLAVLFFALFTLHAARLVLWHDRGLWRVPLLWSLHLAYAWIALACLGMALWHAGMAVNPSLVTHALTVGAMSGLILAMMARVILPLLTPLDATGGWHAWVTA